jgi:hypothetical protein
VESSRRRSTDGSKGMRAHQYGLCPFDTLMQGLSTASSSVIAENSGYRNGQYSPDNRAVGS